jgi:hypothetical protein
VQGATSTPEVQPVAFKATEEKKEESTPSRLPIDASKLDNEMTLIIKSFHQILKQRRGKDYKPRSKRVCYRCGKSDHFIAKCPYSSESDRDEDKKGKKKMEKNYYKKKGSEAHMGQEWDYNEDAANIAVNKGLLFPMSATSVSWLRMARRRYTLEPPLNILHPMMMIALAIMKMI